MNNREDAIASFEEWAKCNYEPTRQAAQMALAALRPVSRERVEQVWKGEWVYSYTTAIDHFAVVKCSRCGHEAFAISLDVKDGNFCSYCGAPMTDKAVEMVLKRLETIR